MSDTTPNRAAGAVGADRVNVAARVMERATRGGVMVSGITVDQLGPHDLVTLGVAAKRVHWPVFASKPAGLRPDLAIYRLKLCRENVSDLSGFDSADDKSPQA